MVYTLPPSDQVASKGWQAVICGFFPLQTKANQKCQVALKNIKSIPSIESDESRADLGGV